MPPVIHIACIGSRKTPPEMFPWLEDTAADIVRYGYRVVSGNAPGADQAWARGANSVNPAMVTLCLPWEGFEPQAIHPQNVVAVLDPKMHKRYCDIAAAVNDHWRMMTPGSQRLHARNAMIVSHAKLALGYRVGPGGGTGGAFKIAKMLRVPAHDVSNEDVRTSVLQLIEKVRP